ncbi:nitrate- and nitrite sensing domain-containing protein [Streptomyces sp. AM8-1-1]|uniref:nitrate- and nitrite sensing domain-containing protein n=1 Tax=Streptomyces sp. AM8-1-1 TaxID=3075825 RepID=UPI0028C4A66F|nr:nitrate- and nitrite sensing domain-containing protein [Streptomyces sp. AM8-1-1]WNO70864.1 nitrate- and nitrite sensing domain-containing protein [Streptomyces sp. AM8-1-1]
MRTPRRNQGAAPPQHPQPPSSAKPPRGRRAHAGPPAVEHTGHEPRPDEAPQPPAGSGTANGGRLLRPRTVRAKIISLLMVPVVSLLALWGFATVSTAQDVARLRQLQTLDAQVGDPVTAAVAALQAERRAAVRQVAAPSDERATALEQEGRRTDEAVRKLRLDGTTTVATGDSAPSVVVVRVERFVTRAEKLRELRTAVLGGKAAWDATYAQYTSVVADALDVSGALAGIHDAGPASDARVLLEFARAGEMLAQEDALLSSAHLSKSIATERLRTFTGAVATRRTFTVSAGTDLRESEAAAWRELAKQPAYRQLEAAEDKVVAASPGRKAASVVPASGWDEARTAVGEGMLAIAGDARRGAAERADPVEDGLFTSAGAAVLLGLAAVVMSLVISVRIGRGLVVELTSLRNTALTIARQRLPQAMRRLRGGEEIDIQAEAPHGRPTDDEIGQVGEALGTVHRAALRAAVERAELAGSISGVFVNLARRSQVLVHRQLTLLDTMERRADDPSELGDLFRLDHLTTRMRRHAESLIILSGAAPGRAWRMPVPLTSVVRAAVSEIEDYARVEVRQLPETAIVGAAVADVTHLLAELVENAAQFSPPHTKVRVSGEPVGNGYALEIEDRGLGMGKDALAEANRRLGESEALDLFDSERLGLFVVSRLSVRRDIKVHLRTSPYGGTTAVVLLPTTLLQSALTAPAGARPEPDPRGRRPEPPTEPARPANGAPVAAPTHRPVLSAQPEGPPPPPGVTALRLRSAPPLPPDGELPRRVRQSHLAPQLREAPTADETEDSHEGPEDNPERSPEQVRDRMTAYRNGWTRGGGGAPGSSQGAAAGPSARGPATGPSGRGAVPRPARRDVSPGGGTPMGTSASGTPEPGHEGDRS